MPDLPKGWSSRAVRRRHTAGTGRGSVLWPILFALVLILGGIETLAVGLVRQQDASRLAAAPVCSSGQRVGCRLDERVTVVNLATESAGRSGTRQVVKVQTPDGSTQSVYATDHDAGLWSRLYVAEEVNAELWNGSVVRLDDGAGHYVIADDSPVVTAVLLPVIGLLATGAGGILLALCVRPLWRKRASKR